jgi:hypothetical protein
MKKYKLEFHVFVPMWATSSFLQKRSKTLHWCGVTFGDFGIGFLLSTDSQDYYALRFKVSVRLK